MLCIRIVIDVEQRGVKSNYFGEDLGILKDYLGKQL